MLVVRGMQRDFIDRDTRTCNFEGEEFIQLLEYCRLYGRESGQGGTVSMDACALNARSKNKEGAWIFMNTLFHSAYQETEGLGWPVCKDAYDAMWEKAGRRLLGSKGTSIMWKQKIRSCLTGFWKMEYFKAEPWMKKS